MNFEEFTKYVAENIPGEIEKINPSYKNVKVMIRPVNKTNQTLTGLSVTLPGSNCGPTCYLENCYEHWLTTGESLATELQKLAETLVDNMINISPVEISDFLLNFHKVAANLHMKLINAERNQKLLNTCPHKMIADLALLFYVNTDDAIPQLKKMGAGTSTITITNEIMSKWDSVNVDVLYEIALRNTSGEVKDIVDAVAELRGEEDEVVESMRMIDNGGMFVVTNKFNTLGASEILPVNNAKKVRNILGDFYILPSSIHELICVPKAVVPDVCVLKDLVASVNNTEVQLQDQLSYNVYEYDFTKETLQIVA